MVDWVNILREIFATVPGLVEIYGPILSLLG